ncbi:GGDEF domain-containing protein [Sulfurimonas sp.]|uniref:GGDEF domain-containing protein n=1 Tax=Sulfurimonas sp. TaxID=2022749 RepID=UPI00262B279E|nr:GGDEF domain-containing protein [Sulfurimonas sp.]
MFVKFPIIELFSNNSNSHGIIITKNSLYYGFLSSKNIIKAMNEENLLLARDQNPLTKMPGNRVIEEYMQETLNSNKQTILCYFDLDNFKAFNDAYGFRNGDRIIQLFANILTKHLPKSFFKGHIGGDDFFVAQRIQESDINNALLSIIKIIEIFENNARDFYSQNDKGRGYIIAQDRERNKKQFPFLTVSAAILLINMHGNSKYLQNAHEVLAIEKKVAKHASNHLSISSLL